MWKGLLDPPDNNLLDTSCTNNTVMCQVVLHALICVMYCNIKNYFMVLPLSAVLCSRNPYRWRYRPERFLFDELPLERDQKRPAASAWLYMAWP